MTKKLIGWENQLSRYIRRVSQVSFRPGHIDCALFGAGGYAAMTGDNSFVEKFAGKYRTIEDGLEMLSEMGYLDHIDYAASQLPEHATVLMARRGDLASFRTDSGGQALGIVQGETVYLMTLQGVGLRSLAEAERAFAV